MFIEVPEAAADAETVHVHTRLRAMNGVGDTATNLKEAIGGETPERCPVCGRPQKMFKKVE